MRNLFFWRLPPSEADFSRLWEDATFVFDTNFLLDLYRVSHSTSEDFLNILQQIKNRIWLPYQVADEFFRRREEIIDSESASFQTALSALENWKKQQQSFSSLKGNLRQAGRIVAAEVEFLFSEQKNYLDAVDDVEKIFREKIEKIKSDHSPQNSDEDSILKKLLLLFDSKVGQPFDEQKLQNSYKEAEDRYKLSKPPGFIDAKDKQDERKYGDFILWKQILEFAKKESRPIIFITGEKKPDWWSKKNNKIISPHLDLRREFNEYVQQPFWMYQTQDFLPEAKKQLMVEIDPKSIEETNTIADIQLVDEQEGETLKQAIEQIQILNVVKAIEQMKMPNSEFMKTFEQIIDPTPGQKLIGQIKAFEQIIDPTPGQKLIGQIKAIENSINTTPGQKLIEQMKAFDQIIKPTAVQQLIEQMRAVDQIIKRTPLQQELTEQMRAFDRIIKPTAVQQLIEQMNLVRDNRKYHIEIPIQKQISQITKDGTPEKENSQKIDTQARNNEPTTLPILDQPQEDPEQDYP